VIAFLWEYLFPITILPAILRPGNVTTYPNG
jgi:hypothetical protein